MHNASVIHVLQMICKHFKEICLSKNEMSTYDIKNPHRPQAQQGFLVLHQCTDASKALLALVNAQMHVSIMFTWPGTAPVRFVQILV